MCIIFRRIVLSLAVIAASSSAFGVTINVPCDYLSISNALLNTAAEGDTVLIGAGDCVISNEISINRHINFTIAGSGTNQTTLRSAAGDRAVITAFIDSANSVFTVRDLNCVGTTDNSTGFIFFISTGSSGGRFHAYNLKMTNVMFRGINAGTGNTFGLIDHCYMSSPPTGAPQFLNFQGAGYRSWTNTSNPLGTTNAVYVEDCTFVNRSGQAGNGFWDAYDGAQFVIRRCLFDGFSVAGMHGYDSQPTSARTWEIYNNVFTNLDGSPGVIQIRGGTGMIFSNACFYQTNSPTTFVSLRYYRACITNVPQGTPTNSMTTGWNPYGQPGMGYAVNFTGRQEKYGPIFNGNPTDGQTLMLGITKYTFVSSLANATFGMVDPNGYGGGAVLIGSDVAHTITNLFHAINADQSYYGIAFTNWSGYDLPYRVGHDFLAVAMTTTNLTLTNALDGNRDQYGYPANQQEGVLVSYPLSGSNFVNNQVVFPCYEWSNKIRGVQTTFDIVQGCTGGNWPGLQAGRDYFDNVVPAAQTYQPLSYPHPLNSTATPLPLPPPNMRGL